MTWLERVPRAVLLAHAEMMDRMIAEEAMTAATCSGIGASGLKRGHAKRQMERWKRQARGPAGARPATLAQLSALGFGVVMVPNER